MKIGGTKLTLAQKMLLAMGLDHSVVLLGHRSGRLPSFTKSGPGRKHVKRKTEA